jgi:MerR family mercuric resistance operon transcriptional regulator
LAKAAEPIHIGSLSARTGVNIETIRYYERIGVLRRPARSPAGHRRYSHDDIRRLSVIRRLRELGFSLEDARAFLDLAEAPRTDCGKVRSMAAVHLADVRTRIVDLRRMERVLTEMVASCDGGVTSNCPIVETLRREAQPTQGSLPE